MKEEKMEMLKYEADRIINGNKTMDEVAKDLNISTRTLQIHINKQLKEIDPNKYEEVRKRLAEISKQKNAQGGAKGKKTTSYDLRQVSAIADNIISRYHFNLVVVSSDSPISLREAQEIFGIPKSTLEDLFMKYLDDERKQKIIAILKYNKETKAISSIPDSNDEDITSRKGSRGY